MTWLMISETRNVKSLLCVVVEWLLSVCRGDKHKIINTFLKKIGL